MKILVIRFSSIGDIVLTTPIVRCLRKTYPDAQIHFLTKAAFKNSINSNPNINKYHFLKKDLNKLVAELDAEQFDYIIDLHHNFRSWLVKRKLRVKSFSYNKLNLEKWLLVHFKINRLPDLHIVDRYFETVAPLNVHNDGEGLDFFINIVDEVDITRFQIPLANGFIALVISGTFSTKRLPVKKVVALINKLNMPVVLLGGKTELDNADRIMRSVPQGKVYNAVNKFGIAQSASLIKQAQAVITNDTGMMHIAAALQKKIISVWGNTIPQFGMTPYFGDKELEKTNSVIVEVKDLKCRPCSKLGYNKCPQKHFKCMNDIDLDAIVNALPA